ncbi:MAG: hypothetical protein AAB397_01035 [Patescibacteria group bacterium]
MNYVCKNSSRQVEGFAVLKSKGIEFYPLPFGKKEFFNNKNLSGGFFILEPIPEESFEAVMKLREGTFDAPSSALKEREVNIKLIIQAL